MLSPCCHHYFRITHLQTASPDSPSKMKGVGDSYNSVVNRNVVVYMRTAPTSHCQYLKQPVNILFDHPILGQILELYINLSKDGKDIVFIWVPAIWALGAIRLQTLQAGDVSVELIPFSDLKSHANKYILQLGQSEWDEFLDNKLHTVFPVLNECYLSLDKQKRRDCDSILAILLLLLPFYWRVRNCQCASVAVNF